jgi:hypothetical protein
MSHLNSFFSLIRKNGDFFFLFKKKKKRRRKKENLSTHGVGLKPIDNLIVNHKYIFLGQFTTRNYKTCMVEP